MPISEVWTQDMSSLPRAGYNRGIHWEIYLRAAVEQFLSLGSLLNVFLKKCVRHRQVKHYHGNRDFDFLACVPVVYLPCYQAGSTSLPPTDLFLKPKKILTML